MRCLPTLAITIISAIIGAVLAGYVSEMATKAHHVSNMEGGRGMLVLSCIALGFIAGGLGGAIVTRIWKKFVPALVITALAEAVLAGATAGIAIFTADSPPRIDGHRLHLDFEIELPPGEPLPKADDLTVIVAGFVDQYYPQLDLSRAGERDGRVIVAGRVAITSHSDRRDVMVQLGKDSQQDFVLNLPRSPRKQDEHWSDWITPHTDQFSSPIPPGRELALRHRVQPD